MLPAWRLYSQRNMVCRSPPHEYVVMAKLTSELDANLLRLTVEAVREYILFYERNDLAADVIEAFVLLCAIKRENSDVVSGILEDQKNELAVRPSTALPINIESTELAMRFVHEKSPAVNLCFTPRYLDGTGVVREQRMLAFNTERSVNHLRNGEPAA